MIKKFSIFLILIIPIICKIYGYSNIKYYENLIINYTLEDFYTGQLNSKAFLATNLFSNKNILLLTNINGFSEGVYIGKKNQKSLYYFVWNINNLNKSYVIFTFFDKSLNIYDNFVFKTNFNHYFLNIYEFYKESEQIFVLGLMKDIFDIDLFIAKLDDFSYNQKIRLLKFGTNFIDYPIYFAQYQRDNFNGYILLGLIENNNYRDFYDLKLNFFSKRFSSNNILVCFLDEDSNNDLKIVKSFAIKFPRNIIDYDIIKKSIDSVLIRVDSVDRVSPYIVTSFINIDFNNAYISDSSRGILNQFYVDNWISIKSNSFLLSLDSLNINFSKTNLKGR